MALITEAFAELKAEPSIGRAEALRRAMLNLIALAEFVVLILEREIADWNPRRRR